MAWAKGKLRKYYWLLFLLAGALFIAGWIWYNTPRRMKLVASLPQEPCSGWRIPEIAGEAGLPYILSFNNGEDIFCLRNWDGKQSWRLKLSDVHHVEGACNWTREVCFSPDRHVMVEAYSGGPWARLKTWRDGVCIGEVTLPIVEKGGITSYADCTMIVDNAGQITLAFGEFSFIYLVVAQGNQVIATGSYTSQVFNPRGSYYVTLSLDGTALAGRTLRAETAGKNFEYAALSISNGVIRARRLYTELIDGQVFPLPNGMFSDDDGAVYGPGGTVCSLSSREDRVNPDQERWLLISNPEKATIKVLDSSTGEFWNISFAGGVRSGHVTPDGRFAMIIGQSLPPQIPTPLYRLSPQLFMMLARPSAPEVRIYENTGRCRATMPVSGLMASRLMGGSMMGTEFSLSPDGHTVLYSENGWQVYRW